MEVLYIFFASLSGLKMVKACCVVDRSDRSEVDPDAASVGVSGLISSITSFLESDCGLKTDNSVSINLQDVRTRSPAWKRRHYKASLTRQR